MEDGKFSVEKFNSHNYQLWKMRVEDYLYKKYLYLPVDNKANKLTSMTDEEWEILDRKTLVIIRLCLVESVAFNISKENTMVDMINAPAKLYEKTSVLNKVFIMKFLFNMKMSEGGSITNH